ncbi:MAG: helix-turn-helix domain-containing protein [Acetivibrio ethanolgignens]
MGYREHIYEIIARNIRKERRRLGITQVELAERADISLNTIKPEAV